MILNKFLEAKPWLCFLFFSVFCVAIGHTQEPINYHGVVIDQLKSLPISEVSIINPYTGKELTQTNPLGEFMFSSVVPVDSIQLVNTNYESLESILDQNTSLDQPQKFEMNPFLRGISLKAPNSQSSGYEISSVQLLQVIVVREYMQNPLGSRVFPVSVIGQKEIESTNQFSLQDALNQIPGVKMDSRGYNGSRRLNLRGTLTRSPFGVRNVRMTMNGFPLTSSDGSSALELLEPADVSEMRIYKGPTGSYEMTGTGGLLALQLKEKKHGQYEIQLGAGEFGGNLGMSRAYGSLGLVKGKLRTTVSGVFSKNEGYRTHEANDKAQISLNSTLKLNNRISFNLLSMLYDGYWELPGHINLEQVEEDPTQSNEFSQNHNAAVDRKRAYLGLSQNWMINDRLRNNTRVFSHLTTKLNPYGTNQFFQGLKEEAAQEFGGRTEFTYYPSRNYNYKWNLKAGGQIQYFKSDLQEYDNDLGEKGSLKYDNETFITEGLVFGSAEWKPTDKLEATAQLGYNLYSISNSGINNEGTDLEFEVKNRQKLLPRIGILYKVFNQETDISLSYAHGIAYPGIFEWVDTDSGLFSETLNPEESKNVELGFKSNIKNRKIDFGVSVYLAQVTNTITKRETEEGATFYENAGESKQRGVELQSSYNHRRNLKQYTFYVNTAFSDYEFKNDTSDLKLRVPGIVPLSVSSGVRFGSNKLQIDVHGRYVSSIPISTGEELNSETDYVLVNAKVNYELVKKGRLKLSMHIGANNLLNSSYTSFFRLNWQGAVFNPMPARNFYMGIVLKRE